MEHKICKECNLSLPKTIEFFHRSKTSLHHICKKCRNASKPIIKNIGAKICKSCKLTFDANCKNFHKSKREKDGLRSKCKTCRNKEKQIYKNNNKEKVAISDALYRNREDVKIRMYNQRREPALKERASKWQKEKYKNDPKFRIKHNLRTSFNNYIKKNKKTFEYIGISFDEFKIYIESKFKEGMTWENYGKNGWHIDHIIPLNSFEFDKYTGENLEALIHKAWHYTNLQPLWAKENMSKGCKMPDELRAKNE